MPIPNLRIIGERINPGFASSRVLLEKQDLAGLQQLAIKQAQQGADYLTINVGEQATRDPKFLAEVISAVQAVVDLPLAIDYPNREVQEVALKVYDPAKARGRKPIVNSISELRWDMIELTAIQPFELVLMASERLENGAELQNRTAQEVAETAARMAQRVLTCGRGFAPGDLFVDVSVSPLATDTEGLTRRAVDAITLLGSDPRLAGVHMVVGLSNLGIMLPKTAIDGSPLNVKVESAFLTLTVPKGLDTILGTPGRNYQILPEGDFVLRGVQEAIALDGFDTLMRVQQLYQVTV